MSGARGFHNSSGDVNRSFGGARTGIGYDSKKGAMSDILGGGSAPEVAPPPRARGGIASLMDHSRSNEVSVPSPTGKKHVPAPDPTGSAMKEAMRGVGAMGVDDRLHGLSRRAPSDPRYSGQGALSALRHEAEDAGADDPFRQHRVRPKMHPRDAGVEMRAPPGGLPGTEDAAERAAKRALEDQEAAVRQHFALAHQALVAAVSTAPREPTGALADYRPLLALLATHNLRLNADGAGTLIATLDVQGSVSFQEFMEIIAMGLASDDPPPAAAPPSSQPPYAPQVPRVSPPQAAPIVRGVPRPEPSSAAMTQAKGQKASLYAEYLPNYPKPPEKQNVHALLQGQRVANSGANQNLANLLNPGQRHNRKQGEEGDLVATNGKSSQWR